MKAFAYLRVSGLGQVDGDGFDRQLAAVESYASAHNIDLVRVYREEGVSGKTDLDGRPALQQMIVDLLSNGTRLVLIEKLDRLARYLQYQESILQDLKRRGIEIISVTEPDLCSDDPTRTLMRQILGAFFQYERTMIVAKTGLARARIRAKLGRCEGRKPYGSRPGEPETISFIISLSRTLSPPRIAAELRRNGMVTRYGKQWTTTQVRRVLLRQAEQITIPTDSSTQTGREHLEQLSQRQPRA